VPQAPLQARWCEVYACLLAGAQRSILAPTMLHCTTAWLLLATC